MFITKTPLRISFFGGGTDYPAHYDQHGGAVLNTSIDQYVYITVTRLSPLFDFCIRVAYSRAELVKSVGEIVHPSVRCCLQHHRIERGIEITVTSDLPARTGLGSSSAFTVGLLHALHAFQGRLAEQRQLAEEAIHVEQKLIGERVGSQDQIAAAMGGLRRIVFRTGRNFDPEVLPVSQRRREELHRHLLMFFTGISRSAEVVLEEQSTRTRDNLPALLRMRQQVDEATALLCDERQDIRAFGELLQEAWELKKSLSSRISLDVVDRAYAQARAAGALGGKLLGAGGGGFLLIFAEPGKHAAIRQALAPLVPIPFGFEQDGTRLIYASPQRS
jgi:D-glycero-alpha-D-manno-heptose-7-phosphate kinase